MKSLYFFAASIFAIAMLVPLGAPIGALAVGIMLAALFAFTLTKPKGVRVAKLKR